MRSIARILPPVCTTALYLQQFMKSFSSLILNLTEKQIQVVFLQKQLNISFPWKKIVINISNMFSCKVSDVTREKRQNVWMEQFWNIFYQNLSVEKYEHDKKCLNIKEKNNNSN